MTISWCTVKLPHFSQEDNVVSADKGYSIRMYINLSTQLIAWFFNFLSQNVIQKFRSNFTDDLFYI